MRTSCAVGKGLDDRFAVKVPHDGAIGADRDPLVTERLGQGPEPRLIGFRASDRGGVERLADLGDAGGAHLAPGGVELEARDAVTDVD